MTFAALQMTLVDGRSGRIFASTPRDLGEEVVTRFTESFLEDDDVPREAALRALFGEGTVRIVLHRVSDRGDIVRVYLQSVRGGPRLFACVVVSRERLEAMLGEAQYVLESFSLQVVDGRRLTLVALIAGVEAWAERCLPNTPTPAFTIVPSIEAPAIARGFWTRAAASSVSVWSYRRGQTEGRGIVTDVHATAGTNPRRPSAGSAREVGDR